MFGSSILYVHIYAYYIYDIIYIYTYMCIYIHDIYIYECKKEYIHVHNARFGKVMNF